MGHQRVTNGLPTAYVWFTYTIWTVRGHIYGCDPYILYTGHMGHQRVTNGLPTAYMWFTYNIWTTRGHIYGCDLYILYTGYMGHQRVTNGLPTAYMWFTYTIWTARGRVYVCVIHIQSSHAGPSTTARHVVSRKEHLSRALEEIQDLTGVSFKICIVLREQSLYRAKLQVTLFKFEHKCTTENGDTVFQLCYVTNPLFERIAIRSKDSGHTRWQKDLMLSGTKIGWTGHIQQGLDARFTSAPFVLR